MDQRELYKSGVTESATSEFGDKSDSLYFERQKSGSAGNANGIFGSSIKKISSNILLDSEHAKNFSEEFINLYKEACRQSDNYTMRDERLEERIQGQRKAYRLKLYINAIYISFLPILITGFETFSSEKDIVSCSRNGVELALSECIICNGNSYKREINISYNIMVYIFWVIVVAVYYLLFYCVIQQSKFVMSMFSFQIKIIGNTATALRNNWLGLSAYTILLFLAIVFNKIVRLYADQDNQTASCPNSTSVHLTITGDNYTSAQYITSIILTLLFSFESYRMIIKLAVEPSYAYFSSQQIFHSTYSSETSYIIQQISKITREVQYTQFCSIIKETAALVKVNYKLPFISEYIRDAILLVSVYKINKDKLFLQGK